MPEWHPIPTTELTDEAYQHHILEGVSRTFALTIPQLPVGLRSVVSNAYLLCRITDTIEDEVSLDANQKQAFSESFRDVVDGNASAAAFARDLYPLLSENTLEAERNLIEHTDRVIRLTHSYNSNQQAAMKRCVAIMVDGMVFYQANKNPHGLKDLTNLDRYCYYVAGVVGEMLTELFCDYSNEIAGNRELMLKLAVSFGQGLQMTNILKDIWEDRKRGACWLPQDIFNKYVFDLKDLDTDHYHSAFGEGLEDLIAIAHAHLRNALSYTLMIPGHETGIRKFCFWALGMALLTLRRINANRQYRSGQQVKISRRSVKATIFATHLTVRGDSMPRLLFNLTATGLPFAPEHVISGNKQGQTATYS